MTRPHTPPRLGIIGGSGLYDLGGMLGAARVKVDTPFGEPSDEVVLGQIAGVDLAFLPRHGRGHKLLPTEVNARANIYALKSVGCTHLISFSAAGSLTSELPPGSFVLPDQFINRTFARSQTFFGKGVAAHVGFAEPTCRRLRAVIHAAATDLSLEACEGGVYVVMEGPQFSTLAESTLYRSWGASIIGMTALPEAKLAREAELCYALIALITDFDCWHEESANVTASIVSARMAAFSKAALDLIATLPRFVDLASQPCPCGCDRALDGAIMTDPGAISPEVQQRFGPLLERVLAGRPPVAELALD